MDRLISLEPSNSVAIRIEPGQKCYGLLTLRNVMYTMPVAFRLQALVKNRYTVRPQSGIISPLEKITIEIVYHLPPGSSLPTRSLIARTPSFCIASLYPEQPSKTLHPLLMPSLATGSQQRRSKSS
ncbi:hypothetical protein M0R45_000237 [Rubus argutus]|uniref:MSP domain-containing protein n=1 Tax=Rubus argutus TaxID=59490 RepID=A0AAW1VND6_RUBAR